MSSWSALPRPLGLVVSLAAVGLVRVGTSRDGDGPAATGRADRVTDGGATWTVLSRGGRSDFHALATTGRTVVGFDGAVRATADGRTWSDGNLDAEPRTLAGSRSGSTVLATTENGLMRSTGGGATWQWMDQAPRLLMAAFGDGESVVGLTPDGQVHTSVDAGLSWDATRLVASDVQALHASGSGEDLEVLVAYGRTVLASTGGQPFPPVR